MTTGPTGYCITNFDFTVPEERDDFQTTDENDDILVSPEDIIKRDPIENVIAVGPFNPTIVRDPVENIIYRTVSA